MVLQLRCSPQADGLMSLREEVWSQVAPLRRPIKPYRPPPVWPTVRWGAKKFNGTTRRAEASRTSADLIGDIFRR